MGTLHARLDRRATSEHRSRRQQPSHRIVADRLAVEARARLRGDYRDALEAPERRDDEAIAFVIVGKGVVEDRRAMREGHSGGARRRIDCAKLLRVEKAAHSDLLVRWHPVGRHSAEWSRLHRSGGGSRPAPILLAAATT